MSRLLLILCFLPLAVACSSADEEIDRLEDFRQRAIRYYDANDLERSEQQARRGLLLEPDHGMLNLILGRTLLRRRDLRSVNEARTYLERAHEDLGDWRSALSLGESHLRYAEFLIGQANLLESRVRDLAEDEAEAVADLEQRASHQRETARLHLDKAVPLLESSCAENPSGTFSLQLLAAAYTHLERPEDALRILDQVVQLFEESRRWKYRELARQELEVWQEEEIRGLLREDLRREVESRGLLATILMEQGRFRDAEEALTQILNLDASLDREYYNRGICRYRQGRLIEAADDMETFLRKTRLAFDSPQVARAMGIMEELRSATPGG